MRKLLLIDDSMLVREVTRAVLGARGDWTIEVAPSGEEGVRIATESPPDAILLDVEMDGIDGRETLGRLRSHERTRGVPVAFLTAHDRPEDRLQLEALGAVDVITKPFDPVSFANRVAEAFGWRD